MQTPTLPPRHQLKYDYTSPYGFVVDPKTGLPQAAIYETVEGFFAIRSVGLPTMVYTSWAVLTEKVNHVKVL